MSERRAGALSIFVGSSSEGKAYLRRVASWIQDARRNPRHKPVPWDEPGLFSPGEHTYLRLIQISEEVDAAVFIFTEDDLIWYRYDSKMKVRDNVLLEYGLFTGVHGPNRAIVCRVGDPHTATDLLGLTVIDIGEGRDATGREALERWLESIERDNSSTRSPVATADDTRDRRLTNAEDETLTAIVREMRIAQRQGRQIVTDSFVVSLAAQFRFNLIIAGLYLLKERGIITWKGQVLRPSSVIEFA